MTRTALISAIALTFAAPAFADMNTDGAEMENLGKTSPAAIADEHNDEGGFVADGTLGLTSPAEQFGEENDDIVSTMSDEEIKRLEDLGETSPAELAD